MEGKGFKSGLSALAGRTNAGKSTLLNALVGTKVAIVPPRPQTTRDTYHGVINRPDGQIVLVDTPGVFVSCPNKLNKALERKIRNALQDVNVTVHVADPTRSIGPEDNLMLELLSQTTQPKILALNKLNMPSRPHREAWLARQKDYAEFVEISLSTD
ncbi:MAG: GTPase [Kiritimatiellia bacterium]